MKRILFLTILPMFVFGQSVHAADAPLPVAECGIAGIVGAGAGYQGGNLNVSGLGSSGDLPLSGNFVGFGEAAFGYGCSNWMAQVDGAYYRSSFTNSGSGLGGGDLTAQQGVGHVGGAVFWRDPAMGRVGLAASEIWNNTHLEGSGASVDAGGNLTRLGGFGDFYASDALTFGVGAFYITGNPYNFLGQNIAESGFEGDLHAKFYASDNISIGVQLDVLRANLTETSFSETLGWNGVAGSAEAEYLIPNTALSLLLGGRYASRNLDQGGGTANLIDTSGYVGVKWAFGAPVTSLRARDRAGTYDNTSVFDEKLPGILYDESNALSH